MSEIRQVMSVRLRPSLVEAVKREVTRSLKSTTTEPLTWTLAVERALQEWLAKRQRSRKTRKPKKVSERLEEYAVKLHGPAAAAKGGE